MPNSQETLGSKAQDIFKLRVKGRVVKRLTKEVNFRKEELEGQKALQIDGADKSEKKRIKNLIDESAETLTVSIKALETACIEAEDFASSNFSEELAVVEAEAPEGENRDNLDVYEELRSLLKFLKEAIEEEPSIANQLKLLENKTENVVITEEGSDINKEEEEEDKNLDKGFTDLKIPDEKISIEEF